MTMGVSTDGEEFINITVINLFDHIVLTVETMSDLARCLACLSSEYPMVKTYVFFLSVSLGCLCLLY